MGASCSHCLSGSDRGAARATTASPAQPPAGNTSSDATAQTAPPVAAVPARRGRWRRGKSVGARPGRPAYLARAVRLRLCQEWGLRPAPCAQAVYCCDNCWPWDMPAPRPPTPRERRGFEVFAAFIAVRCSARAAEWSLWSAARSAAFKEGEVPEGGEQPQRRRRRLWVRRRRGAPGVEVCVEVSPGVLSEIKESDVEADLQSELSLISLEGTPQRPCWFLVYPHSGRGCA